MVETHVVHLFDNIRDCMIDELSNGQNIHQCCNDFQHKNTKIRGCHTKKRGGKRYKYGNLAQTQSKMSICAQIRRMRPIKYKVVGQFFRFKI